LYELSAASFDLDMMLVVSAVFSDPHAWLRPIYVRLRRDHRFGLSS
jgi:hypothetical protein